MARSEISIPQRRLECGRYTATNVHWGMVLDLDADDDQTPSSWSFHGRENQQWDFRPCGAGYLISSAKNGSFLVVRDITRLLEGAAEVVTGPFPTCWELEVMYNGNRTAGNGIEDENGDVFVRILLPLSEMAMSFKGNNAVHDAHVFLTNERNNSGTGTCWRLHRVRQPEVAKNPPTSTSTTMTTTTVTTTTRTISDDV
ncbi:hypothetical protein BJV77DRAFT_1008864 [Russula vinacea]|nr:hypothetical protein BJV77DRAFT_1008864 [Russula vinacea]